MSALRVQTTAAPLNARVPQVPPPAKRNLALVSAEEKLAIAKEQVSHFAHMNDRKHTLLALKRCSSLQHISLDTVITEPQDEWTELEERACRSRITLNGIPIGEGAPTSSSGEVRRVLQGLCRKLAADLPHFHAERLYSAMILRLAHRALPDARAKLNALFGSEEVEVRVPKEVADIPTSEVTVYESGQHIHATFTYSHVFGISRKSDDANNRPWIKVTAFIYERTNLSTGASVRKLELRMPRK